jgi:probable F420-dependent oxidoreductase
VDISVVVRAREDRSDPGEILALAAVADRLGYEELWIGEGPTWDAFVLATAVGLATRSASLTVGPVPVSVRDPATISRGAASVASVTGRMVGVALGTASVRVVEKLHGRSRRQAVTNLRDSAETIRELIDSPADGRHSGDPDAEFLQRLTAPNGPLTVAAFGDRAIQVAADHADRMLLDLVTPEQVAVLRSKLEAAGYPKPPPRLAAWLPAAVEPSDEAVRQILASVAGYLTVAGYQEMFTEAGFGDAMARAKAGADLSQLVEALPDGAAGMVGLVGAKSDIADRLQAYGEAGLDEVAVVPVVAGDPARARTMRELRSHW